MLAGNMRWFAVSLRLGGDGLNPRLVEDLIGLSPSAMRFKGQTWEGKAGRVYGPATANLWTHTVQCSTDIGFNEQISLLFEKLGNRAQSLKDFARDNDITVELFCGFSSGCGQGGDVIDAETLRRLANLGVDLILDLYPPTIDEITDEMESEQSGLRD